jgi:hypothetical protein
MPIYKYYSSRTTVADYHILTSCGLDVADYKKNMIVELRNCSCGPRFLKSCGIAIAEVLPSSCGVVIADAHLW